MSAADLLFVLASLAAVAGAVGVVASKNPVHAAISLMGFFLALSGLYVLLKAPFLAAVQVIVYVGAILVLFLFVIMLLDLRALDRAPRLTGALPYVLAVVLVALVGVLALWPVVGGVARAHPSFGPAPEGFGSTRAMAEVAYRRHALALEIVSVLLLAGIVGAVALAKRRFPDEEGEATEEEGGDVRGGPLPPRHEGAEH